MKSTKKSSWCLSHLKNTAVSQLGISILVPHFHESELNISGLNSEATSNRTAIRYRPVEEGGGYKPGGFVWRVFEHCGTLQTRNPWLRGKIDYVRGFRGPDFEH